ncbi:MAG: hypothetical protein CL609_06330 [Anaerolineaceae bacterium]|nr:hypothetical protein [Anaerolineaceae bacterium]
MRTNIIDFAPVILVSIASLLLLLQANWRWSIIALSLQYIAVFWMVLSVWPVGLAAVKLVTGWMAGAVLGASITGEEGLRISFKEIFQELRFRFVLGLLIILFVFLISPRINNLLPIPNPFLIGGGVLIGMGLLQIGLTKEPLRVVLGLLTFLSGFEVYYAFIERSVMVAGFLSIITLGIALMGAYLLNLQNKGISE